MIKVDKIIPGGQALATLEDGKKAFFWNALPGEIIQEYEITKQKSHFIEAIATNITQPSKFRVLPKDDCFLSTSPWQIIDWDYENQLKSELVVEVFREHKINLSLPQTLTDDKPYFYRNKMEYSLYWNHELSKIELAFHTRGSHQKIPIKNSSIERPEIFQAATNIINDLNSRHEEARKYQSLLLRCNQKGEVSGGLYENHQPHPKFPNLTDTILGQTYSYSPNGFFQINLPVYELALKEIQKHINTDNVLDLYAGVGTIGLSVAPTKNLTLVEVDKNAFDEMTKNCNQVFFERIRSHDEGERADPVTTGVGDASREKRPDAILDKSENILDYISPDQTVILDPPRAGCDHKLIDKLNEIKPSTIIYLSCNPATQARDIKLLLNNYQITQIKTFNFFPRTPHIENLVILQKHQS
ncbi:class I SAM-dependent RNA methyltransferase [Candidatus Saccharibacteria bacterium]|nr:class I SAM-dependent RNA methyltransferase [Candidatus Saccharibacteria bacterium]